jgi:protein-tyrosine phosphatase
MNLLVLCTANICRSPMAERLLRHLAYQRGADIHISSAGFRTGGRPAADGAVRALAQFGLDLNDHLSRRLDTDLLRGADLVVTMESAHVREAAVLAPDRFRATFTLRELVQRGREGQHQAHGRDWLEALGEGRTAAQMLRASGLDVADPYGGPDGGYDTTASELARLCTALADLLWPSS